MGKKRQIKEKLLPTTAPTEQEQVKEEGHDKLPLLAPQHVAAVVPSPLANKPLAAPTPSLPVTTASTSPPATGPTSGSNQLILSSTLIALSSFLWGYGLAVLNVCIVPDAVGSMLAEINLSTEEQETATALVLVGALLSALMTGGVGQKVGHKTTILANNVFFIVGGAACAFATSKKAIFLGRFSIGIACGIVTNTVPILLNEISPVAIRGRITSFHQLLLTIGILATGLLGFFIVADVPSGWRYLNAFIIIPAVIQLLCASWIPESPWWLMKHKGKRESRTTLLYLRRNVDREVVEAELSEIAATMETEAEPRTVEWSDLLQYRSIVVMGVLMVLFQAMTGINTVMLYSAKIFHFAGVTNPFLATAVVGLVNVLVTIMSVSLVDSYGRRPLLLSGTVLMIISLVVLSLSLLYLDDNIKLQGIIAVGSVLLFVSGFAVGLGAVVWVVLADITPVEIRSRAFSLFMGVSYICNILIAVYTLSAINFLGTGKNPEKNGIAKLYLILSGVAVIAWMYIYVKIPTNPSTKQVATVKLGGSDERNALLLDDQEQEYDRGVTTEL